MSRAEEYLRRMRALGYEPSLDGMDDEDIEYELRKMDKGQGSQPMETMLNRGYRPPDRDFAERIFKMFARPFDPKWQMPDLDGPEYRQPQRESRPEIWPQPGRGDNPKAVLFVSAAEGGQGGGKDGSLLEEPKLQGPGPNTPNTKLQGTFPSNFAPQRSGLSNSAVFDDDDKREIASIAEFKKRYGSMINEKAKELGVDPDLLGATIWVESSGSGFSGGKLKIRFENHHFIDKAGKDYGLFSGTEWNAPHFYRESSNEPWKVVHSGEQYDEHAAFESAKRLNPEAAHKSVSMGMGQIMGFNHKAAGYDSAKEMFDDFSRGHTPQINGMVAFLRNDKDGNLVKALQDRDLREYVKLYNGTGDEASVAKYLKKLQDGITNYQDN